jgi:hypothetical protein
MLRAEPEYESGFSGIKITSQLFVNRFCRISATPDLRHMTPRVGNRSLETGTHDAWQHACTGFRD